MVGLGQASHADVILQSLINTFHLIGAAIAIRVLDCSVSSIDPSLLAIDPPPSALGLVMELQWFMCGLHLRELLPEGASI